jgi:hypothetical protein
VPRTPSRTARCQSAAPPSLPPTPVSKSAHLPTVRSACARPICSSIRRVAGIGRNRTVAPSYMGSSDWNKGRTITAPPPDFTKLLDRPSGTTKQEHTRSSPSKSTVGSCCSRYEGGVMDIDWWYIPQPHYHSSGSLGLERRCLQNLRTPPRLQMGPNVLCG